TIQYLGFRSEGAAGEGDDARATIGVSGTTTDQESGDSDCCQPVSHADSAANGKTADLPGALRGAAGLGTQVFCCDMGLRASGG
ncbi:MAG TPA: hypothetical protein VFX42_07075, partial [Gemmatimonadales bacterium]|nr:hypothetical protein [Gemmatimonadales bacterium]